MRGLSLGHWDILCIAVLLHFFLEPLAYCWAKKPELDKFGRVIKLFGALHERGLSPLVDEGFVYFVGSRSLVVYFLKPFYKKRVP